MPISDILSVMRKQPIFNPLSQTEVETLIDQGLERSYPSHSIIAHAGEPWDKFIMVVSGKIGAQKFSVEGRNLWITEFIPGEIFWGFAFFDSDEPMPVTLMAEEDSRIFMWRRETIKDLLTNNGQFSWEMLRHMAKTMTRASQIVEGLAFHPVAGRVANFLLDKYSPEESDFARDLTLDEIAARAGTTREMVCRSLQRFANDGMIEITRTELRIRDRKQLEKISLISGAGK